MAKSIEQTSENIQGESIVMHSGEIVKKAMQKKGLTQIDLAKRIGRDQTLISRYIAGQIEVSDAAARFMAEVLDIDFEEIRRQLQRDRFERRRGNLKTEFQEVLTEEEKADVPASNEAAMVGSAAIEDIITIPLLDSIPKSTNYKSKDKGQTYVLPADAGIDPENSFAVIVKGNDIADDKVDAGDIIIIDTKSDIKNADRVLIIIDGKPILHRIYYTGDTIILQSSNSNEPVRVLSKGDDLSIIGRLAGCYKHF